jgi:hypothetical protein
MAEYNDPMLRILLGDPSGRWPVPTELMVSTLNRPYRIEVELPVTGINYVDKLLQAPVTAQVIAHPIIDRLHTVPYTAGGSMPLEEPTTFIDYRFPRSFTVPRLSDPSRKITFSPDAPLVIHENVEQTVMMHLIGVGFPHEIAYKVAHFKFAEVAEAKWYVEHDINQEEAEEAYEPYLRKIQTEKADNIPANLYRDPYPHDHPWAAPHEAYGDTPPTREELKQALTVLRMHFGFDDWY